MFGTPSIEINLGDATKYLSKGDTIPSIQSDGLIGDITRKIDPVANQIKSTLQNLDTVLWNVNSIFNNRLKGNIADLMYNIDSATKNIAAATSDLRLMLNKDNGSLTHTAQNMDNITKNLADNNQKINGIFTNVEATTKHLSEADINGAITKLKTSADNLNLILDKVNNNKGSLGMLINDKTLYYQLFHSVKSANTLIDDLKMHPKRYMNLSVFGRKDKDKPLAKPLNDSIPAQ